MRVAAISGFFNPLHIGHIDYISSARNIADYLIVIVNSDEQVKIKGSVPFMNQDERLKIVSNIKGVNRAVISIDKEIETIRAKATLGFKETDEEFKEKLEVLKEDRKDDRVKKQAVEQSKLISQRKGQRTELQGEEGNPMRNLLMNMQDGQ